jgi:hypothetical protein
MPRAMAVGVLFVCDWEPLLLKRPTTAAMVVLLFGENERVAVEVCVYLRKYCTYVWPELTNRFFKTPKSPQYEVRDGKIIENEGGLHLGV